MRPGSTTMRAPIAAARVPVAMASNLTAALKELKSQGCFVIGLDGDGVAGDAADALAVALCHAHLHGLGPVAPAVGRRRGGIS